MPLGDNFYLDNKGTSGESHTYLADILLGRLHVFTTNSPFNFSDSNYAPL
jgi:hypothetical protein